MEEQEKKQKPEFKGNLGFIWLIGILVILLGCTVVYTLKITKENKELKQTPQVASQPVQPIVQTPVATQEQAKTENETNTNEKKETSNTRELNSSEKKKIEDKIKSGGDFYLSLFSIQSNYFNEIEEFDTNILKSNFNKYNFLCNMINIKNIKDKFVINLENVEGEGIYISFNEMKKEWKKLYGEEIVLDKLINDISNKYSSISLKKKKNNKNYIFINGVDGLGGQDYKIKPTKITENSNNINVIYFDVISIDFATFKEKGKKLGTAEIEFNSTDNTLRSIVFHKNK